MSATDKALDSNGAGTIAAIDEAIVAMLEEKDGHHDDSNAVNNVNGNSETEVKFKQEPAETARVPSTPQVPSTPTDGNNPITSEPTSEPPKEKHSPRKRSSTAIVEASTNGTLSPPIPRKKRSPTKADTTSNNQPKGGTSTEKNHSQESNSKGRRRAHPNNVANARQIPRTWEEAGEADRKMIQMKEDGKTWKEITEMWLEETGMAVAGSTLPNRWTRIKNNLRHLKEGEDTLLLSTVAAVEARFAAEKWGLVAKAMQEAGTEKYPNSFLQEQFSVLKDENDNENENENEGGNQSTKNETTTTRLKNGAKKAVHAPVANLPSKTAADDETEDETEESET